MNILICFSFNGIVLLFENLRKKNEKKKKGASVDRRSLIFHLRIRSFVSNQIKDR